MAKRIFISAKARVDLSNRFELKRATCSNYLNFHSNTFTARLVRCYAMNNLNGVVQL